VSVNLRIVPVYLFIICFLSTSAVHSQILKDSSSINLLKRGVDDIYNYRFTEARQAGDELSMKFPGHPVIHLYNGMLVYWKNYPLIPSSPESLSYENYMTTCIKICEEVQETDDYAEYLLANLGARGMLLMYYADNNLTEKVNSLVISTYRHVRESFGYSSVYPDFYFFTGLYNYYREAYPEAHPIYKVVAFLFPRGDREKGLAEMRMASTKAIMLKAEAYSFLSYIFMSFENNYSRSLPYTKGLHELYPDNQPYLAGYLKNLLLLKKYNEAEEIIKSLNTNITGSYFGAQVTVFNGILQEKKYHNYDQALKYYNKGISELSAFNYYGNEYSSFAYFGLSRISGIRNDKQNRKTYRKMAMEMTSYKKVNFDE
jgi:tetratricopeptide (TPR) repeat protein